MYGLCGGSKSFKEKQGHRKLQKWTVVSIILVTNLVMLYLLFIYSPSLPNSSLVTAGIAGVAGIGAAGVGSSSSSSSLGSIFNKPQIPPNNNINNFIGNNRGIPKSLKLEKSLKQYRNNKGQMIGIEQLPFSEVTIDNGQFDRMIPRPLAFQNERLADTNAETIFITFPSLNDPDCNETIISAFGNASNPDNLFFGVYEQNEADSHLDCLDISGVQCPFHPICTRLWQIRIERVSVAQAAGPIWGRYKADQFYRGERFLLITDSHTFFRPYWDDILLNLWHKLENEYGILTHYPKPDNSMHNDLLLWAGIDPTTHEKTREKPMSYHICGSIFEGGPNYLPRNANGCYTHVIPSLLNAHKSILVPFWAAGFSFSKAHLRDQVPWDPHMKFVFHGEEFLFASKAWTHGYDMYSLPYDIAFHRYYEDSSKTPRFNINHIRHAQMDALRDASEKRINFLWGVLELRTPQDTERVNLQEIEKYGLGNKRKLTDFWKFAGIDINKREITVFSEDQWSKGGLQRIPWIDINNDPILNHKSHTTK